MTKYGWLVVGNQLNLGQRVDIGAFCLLVAHEELIIEDDVQIGAHTAIYTVNTINDTRGPVRIGKGARIGAHSLILPNTVIDPDSFIKAYSVCS